MKPFDMRLVCTRRHDTWRASALAFGRHETSKILRLAHVIHVGSRRLHQGSRTEYGMEPVESAKADALTGSALSSSNSNRPHESRACRDLEVADCRKHHMVIAASSVLARSSLEVMTTGSLCSASAQRQTQYQATGSEVVANDQRDERRDLPGND